MISFPRGTEMCQFPRLPSSAYVFSAGQHRITGAGFPHSEIRGSMPVQRLTAAYRSRPRPSSAPGAKASTVCPYYLDGEISTLSRRGVNAEGPRPPEGAAGANYPFGLCTVFKLRRGRQPDDVRPRSLKTEQRRRPTALAAGPAPRCHPWRCGGPVDI